MKSIFRVSILAGVCLSLNTLVIASEDAPKFITEHPPALADIVQSTVESHDAVNPVELFETDSKLFSVVSALTQDDIGELMESDNLSASNVIEVLDINSPVRGGGIKAGSEPRPDHKTFVIKRPIPGVGNFPEEKKVAISKGSNAAIAKIGDSIEWVHSYLTAEGTYCVYRAVDEATIREHGKLAGAPILDIYEVN